ncbi:MAG: mechanosensitive ion channel family protein [Spirochaetaceae bacterium]|jgi:small-conductance mechanosensitive channel|nr:mechanosensitive ion channel family protein [Spirochaetaceae bacterium]
MKKNFFLLPLIFVILSAPVFGQGTGGESVSNGSAGSESINTEIESKTESTGDNDTLAENIEEVQENLQDVSDIIAGTSTKTDFHVFIRAGIALGITLLQILFIWLTWKFAGLAIIKVKTYGEKHFHPIKFKKIVLLEVEQMIGFSDQIINILKLVACLFQLVISIPLVFHQFEATRNFAEKLFGYIATPLKQFVIGLINYIPNLFAIIIIFIISRYILRTIKFFANQITRKKLVIPGFYPEWAAPTFNILRILVYAFTIAFIYPHLPNSESDVFKGVSVLVGVIFSLGSSSVVSNLVAGIVMTYMRPFRVGDRIKINDITGFVVERGPMNTRVRTHKNEFVSFPNQMILNTSVTNYNSSISANLDGYIVNATITMGYSVPWNVVHDILIAAALKTKFAEKTPAPFVNQTKLDDFYCWYEINFYTKNVSMLPAIYSDLYKNIQDGFSAANISMYAPHYEVRLNES